MEQEDKLTLQLVLCYHNNWNAFDPIYFIIHFIFIYLRPYSYTVTLDSQYAESHIKNKVNL